MRTTYDLNVDMSNEEKANIIKELMTNGDNPATQIGVPMRLFTSGKRQMVEFITGQEFIDSHKELFEETGE